MTSPSQPYLSRYLWRVPKSFLRLQASQVLSPAKSPPHDRHASCTTPCAPVRHTGRRRHAQRRRGDAKRAWSCSRPRLRKASARRASVPGEEAGSVDSAPNLEGTLVHPSLHWTEQLTRIWMPNRDEQDVCYNLVHSFRSKLLTPQHPTTKSYKMLIKRIACRARRGESRSIHRSIHMLRARRRPPG